MTKLDWIEEIMEKLLNGLGAIAFAAACVVAVWLLFAYQFGKLH